MSETLQKPSAPEKLEAVYVDDGTHNCEHGELAFHVKIVKLNYADGKPVPTNIRYLDITATCKHCQSPMRFRGVPYGVPCRDGDERWSNLLRAPFVGEKEEVHDGVLRLTVPAPKEEVTLFPQLPTMSIMTAQLTALTALMTDQPIVEPLGPDPFITELRLEQEARDRADFIERIKDRLGRIEPFVRTRVSEMPKIYRRDCQKLTELSPPILKIVNDYVTLNQEGWVHWLGNTPVYANW